jgi:transcriptional regulator with XRE-family HTH domain
METLGDKIKRLRNQLTQEDLALILQVDRSTLASWEVNRREPDIATLCRIASYFKVSIDWLVGHQPDDGCVLGGTGLIHETTGQYQTDAQPSWPQVVATAQHYGFEPHAVCQLLELNAQIALSLKKHRNQENTP